MSLALADTGPGSERDGVYDAPLARYLASWREREQSAIESGATRVPQATLEELRRSGLLAAPVPRALGGSGADLLSTVRALSKIAAAAPSTALCIAMPLGNAANTRVPDHAVPPADRAALAQGRAWIAARALAGEILAVANSEPGAQGDLNNTRTRAERDAEGTLRLSGQKCFATLGPDADYFLCSARREDGALDAFFVARTAPGLSINDDWNALGMRATASVSLDLRSVPAAAPFLYPGAIAAVSARHWSTLLLAAVFVGIGEGALEAARLGSALSSSYARSSLAEAALALEAARCFVEGVAREDGIPCSGAYAERCRRAKTFVAKTALEAATRVMMVSGGRAYQPHHSVARFLLDAAAGPLLRPPLPQAMDALANELFGAPAVPRQ